jgi:hypothetical protein
VLADIGLLLSVVCAGLFSGLLLMLTTILHPVYTPRDAAGFARDLGHFLPVARTSPTNYGLVTGLVVAPVLALVGLRDDPTGAPFVLTALGLVLTIAGPLLVSRLLSEPNYDVIVGWDPDHPPADWHAARDRWVALNWIRGAITWVAFALFLAASYAHLT